MKSHSNSYDSLDLFFDECLKESDLDAVEQPQQGKRKSVPTLKRVAYLQDQTSKTNTSLIQQYMERFTKCCSKNCWSWLSVQIISCCRAKYILLPSYEERRKWLHNEVQRMKKHNHGSVSFRIDILGEEYWQCCEEA